MSEQIDYCQQINYELETIFEMAFDQITIADKDGVFIRISNSCEENFGYPKEKILGASAYDLEKIGVFDHSATVEVLKQKKEITLFQETKGNKKLIVTGKPLYDKQGRISRVINISKDVTELENLRSELKGAEALLSVIRKEIFNTSKDNKTIVISSSNIMKPVMELINTVAPLNITVLIEGETGVGKSLFAKKIHELSPNCKEPFIHINCGAIPSELLESELFGYVSGAFTNASKNGKEGLFAAAKNGTLFLDEIGEIPLSTQVKLLRVLEEKEIMQIGSDEITKIDVRIITATNKDLNQSVKDGTFRLDLYFRLNTLMLRIPPLRSRKEDIPCLVSLFLSLEQCDDIKVSPSVYNFFYQQQWEGNIRQLRNTIEYSAHIAKEQIEICHLPDYFENTQQNIYNEVNNEPHEQAIESDLQINNSIEFELYEKSGFESLEDAEIAKQILLLLKEKHVGRRQLLLQLRQSGYQISEYKLRNITANLKKYGYILFGPGREGCRLSNNGIFFVKKNNM